MAPNIYPIHIPVTEHVNGCNRLLYSLWMTRRGNMTWYALGGNIYEDHVEVEVYEMADGFFGGVGRIINRIRVPISDLNPDEAMYHRMIVQDEKFKVATKEYKRREAVKVEVEITRIMGELFGDDDAET